MSDQPVTADVFRRLRSATQARIGLGRVGTAMPTTPLLDFRMAHATARDAVHAQLSDELVGSGLPSSPVVVTSCAADRQVYLQRPDLGRRLDPSSIQQLQKLEPPPCDAVIILADGLSATAVHRHGAVMAMALRQRLADWCLAPFVLAHQARVALSDEIGERMQAAIAVMLIGERPGLSAPDSLGAYLTWGPRVGRVDSERNCVSNIRPPHGLSYDEAANTIVWLMRRARALRLTGVNLKDEQSGAAPQLTATEPTPP